MVRGVSPVVSNVLIVAIVVILAGTISVITLDFTEDLDDSAPIIGQSSGKFVEQNGNSGGIVNITHIAGDNTRVADLEVVVDAECGGDGVEKQGRLVDLPVTTGNRIDSAQIRGDNIFDQRSLNRFGGGALLQQQYSSGDTIIFRIPANKCDITPGDTVAVRIVHEPTNSIIVKRTLTA